jgi:nucleoside phosphorylase
MTDAKALEGLDQYTVGWISALPLERAAAIAMLDEQHVKPLDFTQPHTDSNSYTWGRIGVHNVVITSLAAGVYGTTSAATTAMAMLSSFPYIRIGLMVGIGAGITRPEQGFDIRLGDIAVSQPDGRSGGVIQYDFQKAKPDHLIEFKGSLNRPPEILLKALADLKSQHELYVPRLIDYARDCVKHRPRMAKAGQFGYVYQGAENDRLFQSSYDHVHGRDCENCDPIQEIPRTNRESTDPEIHYGVIASGNTMIKDATTRDSILRHIEEECICFEMESAGLMNNLPCLVIRGISDYADSHKNDRWQRYAALVAAAYAKELLGVVPGGTLEMLPKAIDVLKQGEYTLEAVWTYQ